MYKKNVAILIYEDAEVLDFAGPYEVFAVTSELNDYALFNVFTVAPSGSPIRAVNGLKVIPDYTICCGPEPDVLVVSGGVGSLLMMEDGAVVRWVQQVHEQAEVVLSVCSGARILAKAGLLEGLRVTTHHEVAEHLRALAPGADVVTGARYIDTGRIVTTGGISAGIDGSFHVVARLFGEEVALGTAAYMEYDWQPWNEAHSKAEGIA